MQSNGHGEASGVRLTWFGPAGRSRREVIDAQIERVRGHLAPEALLEAFGGVVMVLNADHQIIAVNGRSLSLCRVEAPGELLGKRLGEALGCAHATDMAAGCGTSRFCRTCGAAVAVMAALVRHTPMERDCSIPVGGERGEQHMTFRIRASPLTVDGTDFVVVTLENIEDRKARETLERVFLHSSMDVLTALIGSIDRIQWADAARAEQLLGQVQRLGQKIYDDARAQRALFENTNAACRARPTHTSIQSVYAEVRDAFEETRIARCRGLETPGVGDETELHVDRALLVRVLVNMVRNALEATPPGGVVTVRHALRDGARKFTVHNEGQIPERVAARIFEPHFSTKAGVGRGLGTYSMKLFGEAHLGGRVGFSTGAAGTLFWLELPA